MPQKENKMQSLIENLHYFKEQVIDDFTEARKNEQNVKKAITLVLSVFHTYFTLIPEFWCYIRNNFRKSSIQYPFVEKR